MPFCTECGTENPPKAKFCFSCGTAMAQAPAPAIPSEERKVITAIFVDLVGSTARSEQLDPEDVKALVAPYHARVRGELEAHGGTFEKFRATPSSRCSARRRPTRTIRNARSARRSR